MAPPESETGTWGDLEEVAIHGVLSNKRRRMTITILRESGGSMSARDLSERIAELETGEQPPPRNTRQSVYVSLIQTHLPKLDELDVIEYDDGTKTITLSSAADQVSSFMGVKSKPAGDKIYLGLALAGIGALVAARAALPISATFLAEALLGVALILIAGLAAYRTIVNPEPRVIQILKERRV